VLDQSRYLSLEVFFFVSTIFSFVDLFVSGINLSIDNIYKTSYVLLMLIDYMCEYGFSH